MGRRLVRGIVGSRGRWLGVASRRNGCRHIRVSGRSGSREAGACGDFAAPEEIGGVERGATGALQAGQAQGIAAAGDGELIVDDGSGRHARRERVGRNGVGLRGGDELGGVDFDGFGVAAGGAEQKFGAGPGRESADAAFDGGGGGGPIDGGVSPAEFGRVG